MEAELMALATSGATTLVGLMVTEGWEQLHDRVAGLFRRQGRVEAVRAELESSREVLLEAARQGDPDVREAVALEWRSRLTRLLAGDAHAVAELQALLRDAALPDPDRSGTRVEISGGTFNGPVLVSGTQNNHFGSGADG
ncbi:hypothetical protein [Streptomyces sp. CBMA123]|uniref:hypothetical protein n=1 Tax=Streptomyces sp. CBMA123 TaxID=1896313 RepID=UPI001661994C|nr:hypothetical protein [Streptomyces sp. CBMA123]MBD0690468.1 hypothetical protein [Streptomyces sp. CBMA123]